MWKKTQKTCFSSFRTASKKTIRLLSKLALVEKIEDFWAGLLANFERMYEHMVEKFANKDAKKGNFNNQSEFRKKSIYIFESICHVWE